MKHLLLFLIAATIACETPTSPAEATSAAPKVQITIRQDANGFMKWWANDLLVSVTQRRYDYDTLYVTDGARMKCTYRRDNHYRHFDTTAHAGLCWELP